MLDQFLPISTPYDPAEDPPGSIDPLGTVTIAEQLADVLLPGLTARMWRAQHLTFTALASLVGERAAAMEGGSEEMRLEARLGLERLFVSAIARKDIKEDGWEMAAKRLPGISLARSAINSENQPLGKQNFLKGQAINGPFGVVQKLARNVDIIDDENHLSRYGEELLLAWSKEQGLNGLLDDTDSKSVGAKWLKKLMRKVIDHVNSSTWPNSSWWGWKELADRLRPDQLGEEESKVLFRLLTDASNPTRSKCVDLLISPVIAKEYRSTLKNGSRGNLDREILSQQLHLSVRDGDDAASLLIGYSVELIEAYEQVCGHAESVFRGLMWAITRRGGRSTVKELLGDSVLASQLANARRKLTSVANQLQSLLLKIKEHPQVLEAVKEERLEELLQDVQDGLSTEQKLVDAVMARHRRVQKQKRKGVWIEQDDPYWTLMPGFGDSSDVPWSHDGTYLHPFRVSNVYSLLSDLGRVRGIGVPDGE